MARKTNLRARDQDTLMRDQAYLYIQQKIVSGELQAGEAVSELAIAKELGSSRTPVREALGQLAAEGFLDQTPNRGAVVVQFGRNDIIDLFELREALEAFAVEKVCRKTIRLGDLDRLQALADEILELKKDLDRSGREALNSSQRQRFTRSDMGFHALLMQMADNPRISRDVNGTRLLIRIFAIRSLPKGLELEFTHQHHSAIVEAVRARDANRAVDAIRNHIQISLKDRLDEFDHWERETLLTDNFAAGFGDSVV